MPQISQMAATYGGQLFWLLLTFGAIFLIVGRGMVPKIQETVDARDRRISDDLASARSANESASRLEEEYRLGANRAREDARRVTQQSTLASSKEGEGRLAAVAVELDARQEQAEADIARRRDDAVAALDNVVAEAAQTIVAKLSPLTVTKPEAARAVEAVSRG